jgi:hypothetical protein
MTWILMIMLLHPDGSYTERQMPDSEPFQTLQGCFDAAVDVQIGPTAQDTETLWSCDPSSGPNDDPVVTDGEEVNP